MPWEVDVKAVRPSSFIAVWLISGFALLSGCSTVGSWFGADKPVVQPAALSEFKPTLAMKPVWQGSVGAAGAFVFSPATDGQAVYAAGQDGRIVKFDQASGREVWRIDAGQPLSAGVGVGAGLVLVGTAKGELLAYRSADGVRAWVAKLSGEILVPPVAAENGVAARSNDGRVYLLDIATGKQRWVTARTLPALTLRQQGHLLLTPDVLYVGHAGGRLSALAVNNGAPQWEANVSLPRGATEIERVSDVTGPLATDGRRVCGAAYQGRVACFDAQRGTSIWTRDASVLRGVDMDERMVYVADIGGHLLAFDKLRGTHPWKLDKLHDRDLSSPAAVFSRYLAVGDFQGQVHVVNSDDGVFAARQPTDGSAIKGVPLALKSGVVVQTVNGGVFSFRFE